MEAREGMISGVTVIGAEAPSTYHVAPRTENLSQVSSSLAVAVSPMSVGLSGTSEKKRRGRPRKYGPDGPVTMTLSPMPISSSAPPGSNFSSGKQSTGRPSGLENKQQKKALKENLGELSASSMGTNFLPHIITVNAGEDVTMKVISFSQQGPRAICILSASGVISNVTLRQPDSSGGTLTYEGRFEILSLSGSYMPTESQGTKSRSGGLSVSLVSPTGRVVGGGVAGLLVAASPVQVVVGSFLPINQQEQKPKKLKPESTPATSIPASTIPSGIPASSEEKDNAGGHGQNNSNAPKPNLVPSSSFQDIWANMHSVQDSRKTGTDINISLPGG